jgi:hypothetical protein
MAIVFGLFALLVAAVGIMRLFTEPQQSLPGIHVYNYMEDGLFIVVGVMALFATLQLWKQERSGFLGIIFLPFAYLISALGGVLILKQATGQLVLDPVWPTLAYLVVVETLIFLIYRHFRSALKPVTKADKGVLIFALIVSLLLSLTMLILSITGVARLGQ